MWCWHKWSVWGHPELMKKTTFFFGNLSTIEVLVQKRNCVKCGKFQINDLQR